MPNKDLIITLVLLGVCIALFVSRRVRPDLVGLFALAAIPLSGVLTFQETLRGFADPIILTIAFMFVISEGLSRTGISYRVGEFILRKSGKSLSRVIALTMVSVCILGSVMSTTAIIAIFLPIVINMCARLKISPSKMMMPLAFAGIISGLMTLVATTPNMILSSLLEAHTGESFGFFSITPIGLVVLALGVAYMLYAHRFIGNSTDEEKRTKARKNLEDFIRDYNLHGKEYLFEISKNSPLIGKTLKEAKLRTLHNANIICVERNSGLKKEVLPASAHLSLRAGDKLFADMTYKKTKLAALKKSIGVEVLPTRDSYLMDNSMEIGMAEISVLPESEFIGRKLEEIKFRERFGLHAIGLRRNGHSIGGYIPELKLKVGDLILVAGAQRNIRRLHSNDIDFTVLSIPAELADTASAPERAPFALLSMAVMVSLMVFRIVPNALAALIGALMMVAFKCLTAEAAYKAVKMPTIILIVCMMPFATALEKTGGIDIASRALFEACGGGGAYAVAAGLFALTMFTGLFMSNTITSILMGPISISAAQMLGVSPYPMAMIVAVAASTAYMSPLSTSVNMLVWEPGRYSFWDFFRIGLPFSIIVMAVCVFLIPALFPF